MLAGIAWLASPLDCFTLAQARVDIVTLIRSISSVWINVEHRCLIGWRARHPVAVRTANTGRDLLLGQ
jgi:hypothetical protein